LGFQYGQGVAFQIGLGETFSQFGDRHREQFLLDLTVIHISNLLMLADAMTQTAHPCQ
jgi:hypothetical protein